MQPDSSQSALGQLEQTQSTAQNPNDILAGQRQQLGVNAAQDTVTGLRGAINNTTQLLKQVAPSVMGRTANSLVTDAQATRQIGNEQAPIQQTLADQTQKYGDASTDASKLESEAEQSANGIYTGQQDKTSYLQNLYSALYGREKDAQATQDSAAALAEQQREFNLTPRSTTGSGNTTINPSPTAPTASAKDVEVPKNNQNGAGGYAFQNAGGNAISAAQYAQDTGTPIGTLLYTMGSGGDTYAQQAYNYVKANPSATADAVKAKFPLLF